MPRSPRIKIKDALYYITCRGDRDEKIFQDKEDYDMFLKLLEKYKSGHEFKLFAYTLLPEHMHLLMEVPKGNLSEVMHDLNSSYTKYFNSRYGRKGHLFRERFRAALVEKDGYLAKISAYVHLNPQELKLTEELKNYPFSSYCFYLDKESGKSVPLDMAEEIQEALGYLKEVDYASFVKNLEPGEKEELHKRLHRQGIVGSDDFVRRIRNEITQAKETVITPKPSEGPKSKDKLLVTTGVLAVTVILMSAGVIYVMRAAGRGGKKEITAPAPVFTILNIDDLNSTEWQIMLTPSAGGPAVVDSVSFLSGKFISSQLYHKDFQPSNFSFVLEDGKKVIWETMQQTGAGATASWRGEIENGKMRGALSRHEPGKPAEDFTFVSTSYRRKQ